MTLNFQFYLKNKKKALSDINEKNINTFSVLSLYGVTGSGKTRVYMNIVKEKT